MEPPARKPLRIGFILANDFTLSAFSLFVDTLRLAGDEGDRSGKVHCDWDVLSANGHLIRSSTGVEVAPTAALADPRRFTHVAVVGGLLRDPEPVGAAALAFLRKAAQENVPLIGVCTGTFILARAGLMRARKVCVSWYHLEEFRSEFPDNTPIADRLFFVDGNRITCSGGAGAADLAALLVERHLGLAMKQKALDVLQIEKARAPSDPQPHVPVARPVSDKRVRRALLIMEQSMADPLPISEIASRCGLSTRGLERLFMNALNTRPNAAYVRLRLEVAHQMVVTTAKSMIEIGGVTGFTHSSNFSRRFKEAFGISPIALRRNGRGRPAASENSVGANFG
ncbi:AraC family transcriptional regulator [Labrys miyagiensis]|uniref:AraC family transcriptional regulator n=1 Tax=Labrys miyagiensis TaxID=346912 RepID=A0ABQ6CQ14_9HYPH|nr:GlxA family transcriptional regulator [Labrys miyagiensis]GLS21829.1 AraC family transcriptional regulator [Labrys miyagiensis]